MEQKFIKGLFNNPKREGSPDFVMGSVSLKVEDFIGWLKENVNDKGYINLDILQGDKGCYLKHNNWQPNREKKEQKEIEISSIPF